MYWILAGLAAVFLIGKAKATEAAAAASQNSSLTSFVANSNLAQRRTPAQGPPLNVFGGAPAPVGGPSIFRPIQTPPDSGAPAGGAPSGGGSAPASGGGGTSGGGTSGGGALGGGGHFRTVF